MIVKKILLLVFGCVLTLNLAAQQSPMVGNELSEPPKTHFKYNAITFGSYLGKSLTNIATSLVLYNQNQFEIKKKLFFNSYAEYYRDQNNTFLSNYFMGQAFINYKAPKKVVLGVGYRNVSSFQTNIYQNFIQFKFEKSFTWD